MLSAITGLRARKMLPRAVQEPTWTCETCTEPAWSPVTLTSTVSEVCVLVTVIVPLAVTVPTPFSWKTSCGGSGDIVGVLLTGLGEGEGVGVDPVPELPHAAAVTAIAASATHLLIRG